MNRFTAKNALQKLQYFLILLCAVFSILMIVFLVCYILIKGLPHISWEFLTTEYHPGLNQTGILPMIATTLILTLLTIIISTPIGIFAAIYLHEYAKKGRVTNAIRFATECLTGIPSIIYGLFGFALFVTVLGFKYSILSGALTMSIVVLPIVIRNTEEALATVPNRYREGSLALGAGKIDTIIKVVLPSAIGGILTSVILSVGRIVGETAALITTLGTVTNMPEGLFSSGRTLATHLYFLAKEGADQKESFAAAAVLLIIVAVINMFARLIARKLSVKKDKTKKARKNTL